MLYNFNLKIRCEDMIRIGYRPETAKSRGEYGKVAGDTALNDVLHVRARLFPTAPAGAKFLPALRSAMHKKRLQAL